MTDLVSVKSRIFGGSPFRGPLTSPRQHSVRTCISTLRTEDVAPPVPTVPVRLRMEPFDRRVEYIGHNENTALAVLDAPVYTACHQMNPEEVFHAARATDIKFDSDDDLRLRAVGLRRRVQGGLPPIWSGR